VDESAVVWSTEALADRDAHYAYIATHNTPARAYAVLRRIVQAIARLDAFPESGRQTEFGHRELVVPRLPYVIEYEVREDVVHIVHIWHTARDRRKAIDSTDDI
jgi:addiction module RelE/StbE family toxin